MYWANLPYVNGIFSVCMACIDHYPLPLAGTLNCLNWVGGGTEREVKGEDCQGGGGRVGGGRGEVKGQLCLGDVVTSVVRQRMGKVPAVQSGHALPMGRCASPPWCSANLQQVFSGATWESDWEVGLFLD